MKKHIALALLLIALGCKNEMATNNTSTSAVTEAPPPPPPKPAATRAVGTAAPQAPALPRMIIRTAEMSLIVSDTSAAIDKITAAASAANGYVADSKLWRDSELLRGTLTLRVPASNLDPTLAAIRKIGTRVQSEAMSSDDVSQEYVDLQSQVTNLEAAEVEMRGLMTTVRERTKKAQDILDVYEQLTQLRGQIEQAKGRLRYLGQMTALSTIKVELVPDAVAKPVVQPGWQPVAVFKDATRSLVGALEGIATMLIWIVVYVLPIVVLLVLGALIAWRVISALRGGAAKA